MKTEGVACFQQLMVRDAAHAHVRYVYLHVR